MYGDSSSFSTVKDRAAEFKRGCTSLVDDLREGCPKTATTLETVKKVNNMVFDDRQTKVHGIGETIGILKERVEHILR